MKQIIFFLVFGCIFSVASYAQTKMSFRDDLGNVKVWDMTSNGDVLGSVYTIERDANCALMLYPANSNQFNGSLLAITGTYTSPGMKVAGNAYQNCDQVGNPQDPSFRPNSYLNFIYGTIQISDMPGCNSISVYKLIEDSSILEDVVNARIKKPTMWRFLVQKNWTKQYNTGATETGIDLMIVDFNIDLTLSEACAYVKALERNTEYAQFTFVSTVSACLLDTGTYRPFLLEGKSIGGKFPTNQSNVIAIN